MNTSITDFPPAFRRHPGVPSHRRQKVPGKALTLYQGSTEGSLLHPERGKASTRCLISVLCAWGWIIIWNDTNRSSSWWNRASWHCFPRLGQEWGHYIQNGFQMTLKITQVIAYWSPGWDVNHSVVHLTSLYNLYFSQVQKPNFEVKVFKKNVFPFPNNGIDVQPQACLMFQWAGWPHLCVCVLDPVTSFSFNLCFKRCLSLP